jgi:uncharacterized membrane protein (DUF4010 family)
MDDLRRVFGLLAISVGLGLLVGLQREWSANRTAGMRTFPLITLLGSISALLAASVGSWIYSTGLLAVALMAAVGSMAKARAGDTDLGLTTEISMLVMYLVGAYLVVGQPPVAIAVGVGTAALLQFKPELHGVAKRLGEQDLRAIMQFALITFIVLPILPNRTFGPLDVFNPFHTWLMVVLIVGIGLAGFLVHRFVGVHAGSLLAGLIGGAVSSTATTVSYSRLSRGHASHVAMSAVVIGIASSVVYIRALAEMAIVSWTLLQTSLAPVVGMALLSLPMLWFTFRQTVQNPPTSLEPINPTNLKSAIAFAGIYVVVLLGLAFAKEQLGNRGIWLVAALSGITDIDAITLSSGRLVAADRLSAATGSRSVIIALVSNLAAKTIIAWVLGGGALARRLLLLFAGPMIGGIVLSIWAL